jgi:hypothetical protein
MVKPLYAIKTDAIHNEQVIVHYDQSLDKVAEEILRIYPNVKEEIENTFKAEIDFRPTVRLIKDRDAFKGISGRDKIVAVAVSKRDLIVIDNSRMKIHPFSLKITLKHELCHLFLHHYVDNKGLPKWLNEGISQWVSDGIAEIITGDNRNILKQAILTGRWIPINELSETFPEDEKSLHLAYEESKSIVEYIIKEHDISGLLQVLAYIKSGDNSDKAVLKALTVSVNDLEKRWIDSLKKRNTWLTYLGSYLYQIIFSLAALLLVYGYIRFLIKKWTYRDEEEEIEEERS